MSLLRALVLLVLFIAGIGPAVYAHEVNPAYLELTETAPGKFDVLWKQPVKDGRRLRLEPQFPDICSRGDTRIEAAGNAVVERWQLTCPLEDGVIRIAGLERTLTDVFVRIDRLEAADASGVLQPAAPELSLDTSRESVPYAGYFRLGVEHILFGFDHLLFVLGLCLVVRPRQLLATVTAFTLAHSVTLALASLGGVTLPGPPVEAVIALSIILLAREALTLQAGGRTLTSRYPWLIAFGFGLIHGFGFAGALSEIGLPQNHEVWALALFNLGVEAGQVMFVIAIVGLAVGVWGLMKRAQPASRVLTAYFIGVAGTAWFIERVASFPAA